MCNQNKLSLCAICDTFIAYTQPLPIKQMHIFYNTHIKQLHVLADIFNINPTLLKMVFMVELSEPYPNNGP